MRRQRTGTGEVRLRFWREVEFMQEKKIKNIVFDMGKVLLDYDPLGVARHFTADPQETELLRKNVFESDEWILLDRGAVSEEEAVERMKGRMPDQHMRDLAEQCMAHWHQYNISPKPGMDGVVRDLKRKGYRTYICSNISLRFHVFQDRVPGVELMDGILISAEEHCLKPEREIYERLFEKFGIRPGESFFIDDLEENIRSAEACGMGGYCFADGDVDKLRKYLGI